MAVKTCRNPECDNTFPPDSRAEHCGTLECNRSRNRQRKQDERSRKAETTEERRERIASEADKLSPYVNLFESTWEPDLDVVGYIAKYATGGPLNPELARDCYSDLPPYQDPHVGAEVIDLVAVREARESLPAAA